MRPRFQGVRLAALIALSIGAAGCTAFANREASHLESDVTIVKGDFALFRQCLQARGGACQGDAGTALQPSATASQEARVGPLRARLSPPVKSSVDSLEAGHPAKEAGAVLEHPFLQKIAAIHDHLRGLSSGETVDGVESSTGSGDASTTLTLSTTPGEIGDFADQVNQATAAGAWEALAEQARQKADTLKAGADAAALAAAEQDARNAAFIHRYTQAYFENGKFVKIELDTKDLEGKVRSELARDFPSYCGQDGKSCASLVTSLENEILKGVAKDSADQSYVLLALGTQGYVSRTGQSFAFPGLQVTLDPAGAAPATVAKIDLTRVGTDLVWVFFQALFDAQEGLPAVSNATGIDLGPEVASYDLPVFDPGKGNVDAQDFQRVVTFSNQVSGAVGAAFDKAVRGIGPFSLNNEALEQLLTAVVTVTIDDVAQKGAWCWYSCNLDRQLAQAAADEKAKIRSDLGGKVKQIKLRLKLF